MYQSISEERLPFELQHHPLLFYKFQITQFHNKKEHILNTIVLKQQKYHGVQTSILKVMQLVNIKLQ